jgi:hypothetical protein
MSHKPVQKTRWAILLCRWYDDTAPEAKPRLFFERLFTSAGRGTLNLVDFIDDVTHGHVDIAESEVFGWITLPQNRSDYTGSGDNLQGRTELLTWARDAAAANGIDLTAFFNIAVCMNATPEMGTDLFGSLDGFACDTNTVDATILAHEMLHGYGLDHSRMDGSTADYEDPWDIMSAWNSCFMEPHSEYGLVGPGLNAANMTAHGFLDESRVWSSTASSFSTTIQLRPLVRRDLPGFLAARVGDYIIEFRNKDRWDVAIPRAAVLVHRFEDNRSYIMPTNDGEYDFVADSVFDDAGLSPFVRYTSLKVVEIDSSGQVATIHVEHRAAHRPPPVPDIGPGIVFGGVAEGGGGLVFIGGKLIRIPPRSPLVRVLEQAIIYENSADIASPRIRNAVRREALSTILAISQHQLQTIQSFCSPAPMQPQEKKGHSDK